MGKTSETRRFPVRVILTATTGRLLTEPARPDNNGIHGLYELLTWMCGESVYTHQLGRFAAECGPRLLRWFPELAACGTPGALEDLDRRIRDRPADKQGAVEMWLAGLRAISPAIRGEYDVPRIPAGDHERRNPLEELAAMRGTDEGIVVITARDDGGSTS